MSVNLALLVGIAGHLPTTLETLYIDSERDKWKRLTGGAGGAARFTQIRDFKERVREGGWRKGEIRTVIVRSEVLELGIDLIRYRCQRLMDAFEAKGIRVQSRPLHSSTVTGSWVLFPALPNVYDGYSLPK